MSIGVKSSSTFISRWHSACFITIPFFHIGSLVEIPVVLPQPKKKKRHKQNKNNVQTRYSSVLFKCSRSIFTKLSIRWKFRSWQGSSSYTAKKWSEMHHFDPGLITFHSTKHVNIQTSLNSKISYCRDLLM